MPQLPPRPDLDQLRRRAKDRVRAARGGDSEALRWIGEVGAGLTLAAAQLRLAGDHGFASWAELQLEVSRRLVLDLRDPDALAGFIGGRPELATADLANWQDHPDGGWPLAEASVQVGLRALVMAADHQRLDVIDALAAAGTPIDARTRSSGVTLSASRRPTDAPLVSVCYSRTAPTHRAVTLTG